MSARSRYALIASFCVASTVLACSFGAAATAAPPANQGATTTPNAAPSNAPPANAPSGDARQVIIDAYTKLASSYPYRVTETDAGGGCPQQTRVLEMQSAQTYHAKWTGCDTGEVISINGTNYSYANGAWTAGGADQFGSQQQANFTDMIKAALQNAQFAGSESLNGANTNAYTFDLNPPVMNIKGGKVWIGTTDGLPHQTHFAYTIGGVSVDSTLVYEYGITVNIKAPIP